MSGNKYDINFNAFVCIFAFFTYFNISVQCTKPIVPLIVIKGNIHNFHPTNSPYYKAYKHF